ncbi:MAG: amidase [Candidatus Melainabacteria bacterium]|nr:amidase [Candidatus Melainabacteria bacterium]
MKRLCFYSAKEIVAGLERGEFSCEELAKDSLKQIDSLEPRIHAWAYLDREFFLEQGRRIDKKIADGAKLGVLAGVPVGIKDVFNTREMPTQMGSPIWQGFTPGNDARVVHYLKMADAVMAGKTVTAEFAVHAPGPTANPHNPEYMPGTSSSGSAAAVASYMVPLALGTQTAGSIVRPASYCGVYGFKPSFGLLPRTAVLKTTDTLDTIGGFARTVEDLSLLFETIRVKGRDYPVSEGALNDMKRQRKAPGEKWRVALVTGPKWDFAEPYAQQAIKEFSEKVANLPDVEVTEFELPSIFGTAHDVHGTIYDRTLAHYFKSEFEKHTLVSGVMYEIITRGFNVTLDQYRAALEDQVQLYRTLDQLFLEQFDIILNLATGGEALKGLDSVDRPDNCLIWTLCHVPAISLPVFTGPSRLPFGAQIVARRHNDRLLLSFAEKLEKSGLVPGCPNPVPAMAKSDLALSAEH